MKRLSLLLCGLLLLAGCRQAPTPLSPEEPVGVFPVEGYVPASADLAAAPYTLQGQGRQFSAACTVRALTDDERDLELRLKESTLDQLAQLREEQPQQQAQYDELMHLLETQLAALEAAPVLYATELRGQVLETDSPIPAGTAINWSLLLDGQVCLSSTAILGTEPWLILVTTPDGSYSEGLLLPDRPAYELQLRWGEETDSFLLEQPL